MQGGAAPAAVSQAVAGNASAYNSTVQDIYIAYFGRPADPGGLAWYAGLLAASGVGSSRAEVIAAYNTNAAVKDIIDSFGNSAESQALYSGSNVQFVGAIYLNLFNRQADAAGLAYWAQAIDSGQVTRAAAAIAIMGGALTTDASTLAAKNQVSASFTAQVSDARQYYGLDAGVVAHTMLATIGNGIDNATAQQRVSTALADAAAASGKEIAATVKQTGIFLDAPVAGLGYRASPSGAAGTTNLLGQFSYAAGDSVTFSAAGVTLGTTSKLTADATRGNLAVVSPVDLVPDAADATDASVTAIAQWLAGLTSVAAAVNQSASGTFTIPVAAGLSGAQAAAVTALLGAAGAAQQTTVAALPAALAPGGALQAAIQAAGGNIVAAAAAQDNLRQAQNSAAYIGSFWEADCAQCNYGAGATIRLYLNANGVVRGFGKIAIGVSNEAMFGNTNGLIGTWQAATGASDGVLITVVSPSMTLLDPSGAAFNGFYLQGRLAGASGTASVYNSGGSAVSSPLTLSRTPAATGANAAYVGSWNVSLDVITADGRNQSYVPSSGSLLMGPDGQVYLYDARGNPNAPWDMASGVASSMTLPRESLSDIACQPADYIDELAINLASGTVTIADKNSHAVLASGRAVRNGLAGGEVYTDMQDNATRRQEAAAEVRLPFVLNADIHWPANPTSQGATSSLVLGILLTGHGRTYSECSATGLKINTFGLHPVINPLGYGAPAATVRDTFSVDYMQGQPERYQVTVVGPASHACSVTQNGSGAVVDADNGKPGAYPTVQVTCSR